MSAEIHVAVDGSGDVSSLPAAQLQVRNLIAAGGCTDIDVHVGAGHHALLQTLRFDQRDVTQRGAVRWIGSQGATVSPGPVLRPTWESVGGGIYRTRLDPGLDFDQLLVNGRRAQVARYPNFDPTEPLQGSASDAISPERVAGWTDPAGGIVRGLHPSEWGGNTYTILSKDQDQLQLEWAGDNQRGSDLHQQYRMVENILEELDTENEWHYQPDTGLLHFCPPADLALDDATLQLGTLQELINCSGAGPTEPLTGLSFTGFTFTGTHRTLSGQRFEPLLLGDWSVVRKAAVSLRNVRDVSITGCQFVEVGGNALLINGYAADVNVSKNDFRGSGASDILVLGSPDAVPVASTWGHEHRGIDDTVSGPVTDDYPREVLIEDNHLREMGRFEKQTAGVCISMAARITVQANTIHDGPRAAININDGTWGGHRIIGNDIHTMVTETGDHGPINAWGRDRYWPIADISDPQRRQLMTLDAIETTTIAYNRIGHTSDWGVDLDDGSSRYDIHNNLFLNCGVKLREGFDREVRANIFIAGGVHSHVSYAGCGDTISGNLFLTKTPYHFIRADPAHSGAKYQDNHFWNNGNPVDSLTAEWIAAGHDSTSRIADPLIDPPPWGNAMINTVVFTPESPLTRPCPGPGASDIGASWATTEPAAVDWSIPDEKPTRPTGDSEQAWCGATVTAINTPTLASSVGLPQGSGAYLVDVPTDSPAASLGLRKGDVIQAVGSQIITDPDDLPTSPFETKQTFTVWRNQQEVALSADEPTKTSDTPDRGTRPHVH